MLDRCYNDDAPNYEDYGGRGIEVHYKWHDLEEFVLDMFPRPNRSFTLDRIDNNGHYTPWNCRWATAEQQANNKRNSRKVFFEGEWYTVGQLARKYSIAHGTLWCRLFRDQWSMQRALSTGPFLSGEDS